MAKRRNNSRRSSSRDRIKLRRESAKNRTRLIQIVIGLIAVVIVSSYAYSIISRPEAIPVSQARLEDFPSKGSPDALVTITEFGDFACPICRIAYKEGFFDQLFATYGDKIRIEWRDLPVYTPKAAQAGQCAYDQDRFWEFHDIAFENAPNLSVSDLKNYATQIGLDMEQFNQCLDSGQHAVTVSTNGQAANGMGLRGTPSYVVNGTSVIGYDKVAIINLIEAAIAASK